MIGGEHPRMAMFFAATLLATLLKEGWAATTEGCEVTLLESDRQPQRQGGNHTRSAGLQCGSLEDFAAFRHSRPSAVSSDEYSIVEAEIRCGGEGHSSPGIELSSLSASRYPNLTSLSIHGECGGRWPENASNPTSVFSLLRSLSISHLKLLNLSENGLETLPWQSLQSAAIDVIDLRGNRLSCEECANRWLAQVYAPPSPPPSAGTDPGSEEWNVHSIFQKSLPIRALLERDFTRKCPSRFSRKCKRESVEFPLPPASRQTNTTLGARLVLKCRMQPATTPTQPTESPFYWPLSSVDEASLESPSRVEWSGNSDATLIVENLTSSHLGVIACRCFHCDTPAFSTMELRFNVPPTVRVEDDGEGSAHLVLHGYPLGSTGIRVARLSDNATESVETGGESDEWHMFNGTLLIKYLREHSFYFLAYYSLYVHECSDCVGGAVWLGGDYRITVCNTLGCAHAVHRLGHQEHPKVQPRDVPPHGRTSQFVSSLYTFAGLMLIFFFVFLLMSFSTRKILWRKLWGRHDSAMTAAAELKRRRASRHTDHTEETSIPLEDAVSRSLSSSHYVTQHVSVVEVGELKLAERIGRGAFGEVFAAEWGSERVAVKMLQSGTQFNAEMDKEAAMLSRLFHPNVLQLHGITYCEGRVALVMELMTLGDLRNYLRERAPKCSNYSQFPPALLLTELLNISIQVGEGLNYLTSQSIVHRDLAARNCLVSGESDARVCSPAFRPPITVKISDFGMSRRLYSDAVYYRVQSKTTALPVRWLPGDCLSSGRFTHQSDVWAFGVTLYEVFTYGSMPFGNLSNDEVCAAVVNGMRPDVPSGCPAEVGAIMAACWRKTPDERIPIEQALERLKLIFQ